MCPKKLGVTLEKKKKKRKKIVKVFVVSQPLPDTFRAAGGSFPLSVMPWPPPGKAGRGQAAL